MSTEILTEEWREITGFPGYKISNRGRVQSCWCRGSKTRMTAVWKILKTRIHPQTKRHAINLKRDGTSNYRFVHHLVLEAFVGPRPEGMECRHFPDRDPGNNCVENLSWGTHIENMADKVFHGTDPVGTRHGGVKLTEEQVIEIRLRRIARQSYADLAKTFGVSNATIIYLCLGRRWRHLRPDLIEACKAIPDDGALLKRGAANGSAVLTDEKVHAIKEKLARGQSRKRLAAEYGVSVSAINAIAIGKTWTHLKPSTT